MAKGKNSAALFEVINSGKRTGAGLLRTPKWWFKGRPSGAADAAPPVVSKSVEPEIETDDEPQAEAVSTISPRTSRANLRVDRMRNEVTMRMRLGTIVVVSFAILVAMGLAYVIGRHVAGGPESANASDASTEQIRQAPPTPNTMDVARRSTPRQNTQAKTNGSTPTGSSKRGETARAHDTGATGTNAGNVFNGEAKPQVSGPRVFGKNYAILKSSPPSGTNLLQQACDYLNKAGLPCSVEKAPPGFNPDGTWVAIISRQGFTGGSDEDFKAFVRELTAATKNFSKVRFETALCKWQ
ncbi:MAG TPA: hypothetical protein VH370_03955 [Humisphaera sp.]|jgi:hypothetical protein|nr:hypothetical protein [Humisphaera sp.]